MSFLPPYLRDTLTQHPVTRNLAAWSLWLLAPFVQGTERRRVAAFQLSDSARLWQKWQSKRQANEVLTRDPLPATEWPQLSRKIAGEPALTRSLLLKPPGPGGERGVLLVQFEYNWFRLLTQIHDWNAFSEQYDVLWGTSWSPTNYALITAILQRVAGPVSILASNLNERPKLLSFHPRIRCPNLLSAADWLDPACFEPRPREARSIDILMIANWAPFKRHLDLFKALPSLPPSLRIVLVGQKEGGFTRQSILKLAKRWRVPQELEVYESLPPEEVRRLQCDAKIALILSRREGSCVAATEALMADCPLGIPAKAHVGALTHVNAQTGVRFSNRPLAPQIAEFLNQSDTFAPRRWAQENLSCHLTLAKLEAFCKQNATEGGRPWTQALAPFRWNPYPEYLPGASSSAARLALERLVSFHSELFAHQV